MEFAQIGKGLAEGLNGRNVCGRAAAAAGVVAQELEGGGDPGFRRVGGADDFVCDEDGGGHGGVGGVWTDGRWLERGLGALSMSLVLLVVGCAWEGGGTSRALGVGAWGRGEGEAADDAWWAKLESWTLQFAATHHHQRLCESCIEG